MLEPPSVWRLIMAAPGNKCTVSLSPARLRRWLRPQQPPAGISGRWCEGPKKSHVRTRSFPPRSLWKHQGQVFKDGTGSPPPPPPWSLSPAVPGLPWRHCRLALLPRPTPALSQTLIVAGDCPLYEAWVCAALKGWLFRQQQNLNK